LEYEYSKPSILYQEKGILCEYDTYDIVISKEHRGFAQEAFNAMP